MNTIVFDMMRGAVASVSYKQLKSLAEARGVNFMFDRWELMYHAAFAASQHLPMIKDVM